MSESLVIVSSNRAKYLHIRECIKASRPGIDVRCSLEFDYPPLSLDEEKLLTVQEVAQQKALYVMQQLQMPCLSDETLLIVPALGMEAQSLSQKRVHAHSGKLLPDTKKLLASLIGQEGMNRSAYLETVLCLALPDKEPRPYFATARQEGYIAEEERGSAHFDFGSVFIKHEYNKTLSELSEANQIRISHRRKGLDKLLAYFEKWAYTKQRPSL